MPITNFSLFLSITFVVSASPGPVMLSCMTNGGRLGLRKAFAGMIGASLGNLVLLGLSALGLGLLVSQNDFLFNSLKWFGAAYLVFLGVQIIRTPVSIENPNQPVAVASTKSIGWSSFVIAISNPKGLIYFGALFPQFINYQQPLALQFFILTVTFLITDLMWMVAYAMAGNKIMGWLKTPKHQTLFNSASGLILMAAGVFMAFSGNAK